MNITIEIKAPELVEALNNIAKGLGQNNFGSVNIEPAAPTTPVQAAPVQAPIQPVAVQPAPIQAPPIQPAPAPQYASQQPAYQPAPQQAVPVTPQQPATVPVAPAPQYTLEQLGVAAGPLVDAGKGPELSTWLQQRGAQALTQLDKSLYGEFAMFLRSLGAKI